jgi:hypothetical protein
MAAIASEPLAFISGTEAIKIAALSWGRLRRLVVIGRVRVIADAGVPARYCRQDIEGLPDHLRQAIKQVGQQRGTDEIAWVQGDHKPASPFGCLKGSKRARRSGTVG